MTEPSAHANTAAAPRGCCPVEMYGTADIRAGYRLCGRAIHSAPAYDETPVCLMQSRDPERNDTEFQEEVEAILTAAVAEDGVADFTGFLFRSTDYSREFKPNCMFASARFMQNADFYDATFTQNADFSGAPHFLRAGFG